MAWHRHLSVEIAVMFRRFSDFRFWYERGDAGLRTDAKRLRSNYPRCTYSNPKWHKRDRQNMRNWIAGATPRWMTRAMKPNVPLMQLEPAPIPRGEPLHPAAAAYNRSWYARWKRTHPAAYAQMCAKKAQAYQIKKATRAAAGLPTIGSNRDYAVRWAKLKKDHPEAYRRRLKSKAERKRLKGG